MVGAYNFGSIQYDSRVLSESIRQQTSVDTTLASAASKLFRSTFCKAEQDYFIAESNGILVLQNQAFGEEYLLQLKKIIEIRNLGTIMSL